MVKLTGLDKWAIMQLAIKCPHDKGCFPVKDKFIVWYIDGLAVKIENGEITETIGFLKKRK